jgi:hypothetical protein
MRTSVGGVKEGPLSIVLMLKRAEPLLCQQGGRGGEVSALGFMVPASKCSSLQNLFSSLLLAFAYVE